MAKTPQKVPVANGSPGKGSSSMMPMLGSVDVWLAVQSVVDAVPADEVIALRVELQAAAEKAIAEVPREERGKAALTELFDSLKGNGTPVIVENLVDRIDEVVKVVRFDGWQATLGGDQEVRKALRRTLYVQFKIQDSEVYEKAYEYVREYY